MKKAIDQTVRDLKRGVNKNVLKVPLAEQKVLDATSNESWGPHETLLAEIAEATRNHHEYQIIMSTIWKRINDTGRNWRHVYKALIVLEYLITHGSERVIDDIREHAYQISTLSDFQYIDSNGKDQGNNVRRKSQSLVVLVNDKGVIQEVREKAAAYRDKHRSAPTGGMYSSGGYGDKYYDDLYESQYGNRDDDRKGYRNDGRDRDHEHEDDGRSSSRGSGTKDDQRQDGSNKGNNHDRKNSSQNLGTPPNYENSVGATRSPANSDRDGDSSLPIAPEAFSPQGASPGPMITTAASTSTPASPPAPSIASNPAPDSTSISAPASAKTSVLTQSTVQNSCNKDEFDPSGPSSAAQTESSVTAPAASSVEVDLLSAFSEPFSSNSLALVSSNDSFMNKANGSANVNSGSTFAAESSASTNNDQPFDDPFSDGPFRALPPTESASFQPQITAPTDTFHANSGQSYDVPQPAPPTAANEFVGVNYDPTYMPSDPSVAQPPTSMQLNQEPLTPNYEIDILADILPPPASPSPSYVSAHPGYPAALTQSMSHGGFPAQTNQFASDSGYQNALQNGFQPQMVPPAGFAAQPGYPLSQTSYALQSASQVGQIMPLTFSVQAGQAPQMGFQSLNSPNTNFYRPYGSQSTGPSSVYTNPPSSTAQTPHYSFSLSRAAVSTPPTMGPQAAQVQSSGIGSVLLSNPSSIGVAPQSSEKKFETKSGMWADTLSRGLVNLNISGPKANPTADIGVDFDAINRKEKRMEKHTPTTTTVTSTITMGKAMGSGSGLGRAGANSLRSPPNPMMNSGMGGGIGMGGYGMNPGVGMGMGMHPQPGTGMWQGMGMNMQQTMGYRRPPGSTMPGGPYNNMMGPGNYGGGYR